MKGLLRTLMLLSFLIHSAYSSLLLGVDCPQSMYAHEILECRVLLTTTGEGGELRLFPHGAEGLLEVSPPAMDIEISEMELRELEVNIWARNSGADAIIIDIESDKDKMAVLRPIEIKNPPIAVKPPTLSATAGKRKTFTLRLAGSANNVRVWLLSPTNTIDVSEPVDVGDISESAKVGLYIVPSPTSMGSYTLYLMVSFVDDRGAHLLKYPLKVWVNPSFLTASIFLGALLFVVFLAYWMYRKVKKRRPNEAQ